jgi:hypothetical protein
MQPPDLNHMYETFVLIDTFENWYHLDQLRQLVGPTMQRLRANGVIGFYCFLIHGYKEGVPTHESDKSAYWHIRVSVLPGVSKSQLDGALTGEFKWTQKIPIENVAVIEEVLSLAMHNQDTRQAWLTIGEQSEWVLRTLDRYVPEVPAPIMGAVLKHYLHYFSNMTSVDMCEKKEKR